MTDTRTASPAGLVPSAPTHAPHWEVLREHVISSDGFSLEWLFDRIERDGERR